MTTETDLVAEFISELRLYGRSETTLKNYETTLRQFFDFVPSEKAPAEITRRDCLEWIDALRDDEYSDGSIRTKAVHVNRFFKHHLEVGNVDTNPMAVVSEQIDERADTSPTRRKITINEMRDFIQPIQNPLSKAILVTFIKTGMRVGELCNLDLRDLSLDDPRFQDTYQYTPRPEISNYPNTLYVSSTIDVGDEVNGEIRQAGNKRSRDTRIPIDEELQQALLRWLAIRPDTESQAEPLFTNINRDYGTRLTTDMIRSYVKSYSESNGWYTENAGVEQNVTPHYFRHFFTTEMRKRTESEYLIKYLRGDSGDIMDRYTHDWDTLVRETYLNVIFTLTN